MVIGVNHPGVGMRGEVEKRQYVQPVQDKSQPVSSVSRGESAAFVMTPANGETFRSPRIRFINRRPRLLHLQCCMVILSGDVKEPTHLSDRVGDEIPGVVVWPCFTVWCFT